MPELPAPAPSEPSADAPGTTDDLASADILQVEAATDGTDPAASSVDQAATEASDADQPVDDGAVFLAELTKAMQASAAAERERANAEIDRRRLDHLARIEARRTSDAESMTTLADQDLKAIDEWAEGERQRIDREKETRAAAVRDDLQASLAEHGARVDREVEAVEAAINTHRASIDAFFAELDGETEPVAIALHARRRPSFPSLTGLGTEVQTLAAEDAAAAESAAAVEAVAPDAEAFATDGSAERAAETTSVEAPSTEPESGVAVMATAATTPVSTSAWHPWGSLTEAADAADAAHAADAAASAEANGADSSVDGPERLEVVAVTSSASKPVESSVLQTVKVSRPLSWLRRGDDQDPE